VVRASSTTVKLASSLANAQNGTVIDFTAKSSPVWTITHTDTMRTLGEYGGAENHAMSSTELLAHTHPQLGRTDYNVVSGGTTDLADSTTTTDVGITGSTGGNAAMNNMSPYVAVMMIIKI
jgi:microcystin-dependent protein